MASTTNYSWSTPDNSGLVKNGAQDMRTLGDAIDTSVWNVGFGQAGKNKIINGNFANWQRGTSITFADNAYTADRFICQINSGSAGTGTVTQQTFTPATAPVAGYEGQYFWRYNLTATGTSVNHYVGQRIEDVRTFAGQTATLSFWGKADSARTITSEMLQVFGLGGSGAVTTTGTTHAFTTSWQRFTVTFTVPSISGKTIGTSSYLMPRIYWTAAAGATIDTWGWQMEYGSKATPFQTATGTIQGELAACQRYYEKSYAQGTNPATATETSSITSFGSAAAVTTSNIGCGLSFKVIKRTTPTLTIWDGAGNSGKTGRYTLFASTVNNNTVAVGNLSDANCLIYSSGSASAQGLVFQYAADAEL